MLGTTEKENVEDETAAEWVGGFGEPDWDNQPPVPTGTTGAISLMTARVSPAPTGDTRSGGCPSMIWGQTRDGAPDATKPLVAERSGVPR